MRQKRHAKDLAVARSVADLGSEAYTARADALGEHELGVL